MKNILFALIGLVAIVLRKKDQTRKGEAVSPSEETKLRSGRTPLADLLYELLACGQTSSEVLDEGERAKIEKNYSTRAKGVHALCLMTSKKIELREILEALLAAKKEGEVTETDILEAIAASAMDCEVLVKRFQTLIPQKDSAVA